MSKGTILYVGNFELPDKGASANRVMSNRKLFQSLGYRVVMLGVVHEEFPGIRISCYEGDIYEEACPQSTRAWAEHLVSTKNMEALAEQCGDVRMIILYNAPYVLFRRCYSRFHKKNIKVCYDCTEWTTVTEGSFVKRFVKKLDGGLIRRRLEKKTDGLIVISSLMKRTYQKVRHLLLLPPLVDVTDSIWHQTPGHCPEKFEFCFAGMLDGNKDSLDKIVEAFARIKGENAVLRIIGVTKEEFLAYYPDKMKFLSESVIFMGKLTHEKTLYYVNGCGCYIFIRQSDLRNNAGFPTKFAEAYTSGKPLIATDISDIRSYMDQSRGLILENLDISNIAEAMEEVMEHSELYQRNSLDPSFHYLSYRSDAKEWIEGITA